MTPEQLRAIVRESNRAALLFDFDGTLAPIVDHPADATPVAGALDLLVALAATYARVAIVSGRPRSFLAPIVDPSIELSALYGLESRVGGHEADHPDAAQWRGVVDRISDDGLPDGVVLEPKQFSLTAHYRQAPEAESSVLDWAARMAAETGLEARPAKASVELHPPLAIDKGTAVHALAAGCDTVVFVGDDLGDLPAFHALDKLAQRDVRTVKVASATVGLPAAIKATADLVVDGPAAVVELFAPLVRGR